MSTRKIVYIATWTFVLLCKTYKIFYLFLVEWIDSRWKLVVPAKNPPSSALGAYMSTVSGFSATAPPDSRQRPDHWDTNAVPWFKFSIPKTFRFLYVPPAAVLPLDLPQAFLRDPMRPPECQNRPGVDSRIFSCYNQGNPIFMTR